MYPEEEYLQLSGIQHFAFCKRQWALIHLEMQWEEDDRTMDGRLMHRNVHNADYHEKRGDTIITRAMKVSSARLGLSGECDVVECRKASDGVELFGLSGTYAITPIEYKRGSPKEHDADVLQLTAQALCLEEMLCCDIPYGYLYYGETARRMKVEFSSELRKRTEDMAAEMHRLYARHYTPKVKRTKACNACSLKDICLPVISGKRTASGYVQAMLEGEMP